MTKLRYLFHIGYKGTKYRGWQKQVNAASVQETLENTLSSFCKEKVHCIGCGRTDAGVHASQFYFHANISNPIDEKLLFPINRMLPSDISVYNIKVIDSQWHAQHSAISRTYNYFIHTNKNPYLNEISSLYAIQPDLFKMQKAANLLLGKNDYRAFCKTPDRHNHTYCNVEKITIYSDSKEKFIRLEITANRFLKGMIRILVHQLIELGEDKLSLSEFLKQFHLKQTPHPLKLAYPQGLYLSHITYPNIDNFSFIDNCPLINLIDWIPIETSS